MNDVLESGNEGNAGNDEVVTRAQGADESGNFQGTNAGKQPGNVLVLRFKKIAMIILGLTHALD